MKKNQTVPKSKHILLKGWLVETKDDVHYTSSDYDKNYKLIEDSEQEQETEATVLGLKLDSNETIILAEELERNLNEACQICKSSKISATIRYHVSSKKRSCFLRSSPYRSPFSRNSRAARPSMASVVNPV